MVDRRYTRKTVELSAQEYVRIFKEAYNLRMPRYDLRVWDTCLFSKCTNIEQVHGLLMMFDWPILYLRGSIDGNIRIVGKWYREGTFVRRYSG